MKTLPQPRTPFTSEPPRVYTLRLATTADDLAAAQRLRFEVFNRELGEGLAASEATGLDADPFDEFCDHLLVETAGTVVGTYRMQTGQLAAAHLGYYSEQEFDFAPYERIRCELVELGRACVHRDHRSMNVIGLLWRGIARYAMARQARYLIGCSSLSTVNPVAGSAVYAFLRDYLSPEEWQSLPRPGYKCPLDRTCSKSEAPPRLLRAYLAIGATICGPPALDREFGTIDFLTLLDLGSISPAVRTRFLA
jgi:putative hemolysin